MRLLSLEVFIQLAVLADLAFSATVYVTDLPVFSALGKYPNPYSLLRSKPQDTGLTI